MNETLAHIQWSGAVESRSSIESGAVSYATIGSFTLDSGGSATIARFGGNTTGTLDLTTG